MFGLSLTVMESPTRKVTAQQEMFFLKKNLDWAIRLN